MNTCINGKLGARLFSSRTTKGQGVLYDSVLDTVGNTPVFKLKRLGPSHVSMYVKAEYFNPASSIKDRLAVSIIEEAERSGHLKPGQTVVEATSGNTGVGLAMVCAARNYPCVIVMADSFSIERRKLMRFLGAKVILTPREYKGTFLSRSSILRMRQTRISSPAQGGVLQLIGYLIVCCSPLSRTPSHQHPLITHHTSHRLRHDQQGTGAGEGEWLVPRLSVRGTYIHIHNHTPILYVHLYTHILTHIQIYSFT